MKNQSYGHKNNGESIVKISFNEEGKAAALCLIAMVLGYIVSELVY